MKTILFLSMAAFFNAVMDIITYKYDTSIFLKYTKILKFLNPNISWTNKWKGGNAFNGERFWGSSTFLVFLTDGWHLCKFLMLLSFGFAIVSYKPIFGVWDAILFYTIFGCVFELSYRQLKQK